MEISSFKVVPWREVALAAALSYGVSWIFWLVCIAIAWDGGPLTSLGARLSEGFTTLVFLGDFGPLIAAIVMRHWISREGLRNTLGFRRSVRWYILAISGPILIISVLTTINHLTGLGRFTGPATTSLPAHLFGITFGAIFVSLFVFGEEYSWRGYILPRLLPLGEVRASMILGLIWAFWHLPLLLIGLNYPGENLIAAIVVFTGCVLCLTLLITRFFVAAGGSVVVMSLFHGFLNSFGSGLTGRAVAPEGNPLIVSEGGLIATFLFLTISLALLALRKRNDEKAST